MIVLSVIWFIIKYFLLFSVSAVVLQWLSVERKKKDKYIVKKKRISKKKLPKTSQEEVIIFGFLLIVTIFVLKLIEFGVSYLWDLLWLVII